MPEVWEGKHYVMFESINFDDYMIELGVGYFTRLIGNRVTPTISLEKNGDKYKLTTESTFRTSVIEFEIGKEFPETTLDDREVHSIITWEGNKLVHKQDGTKPSTITREFTETHLNATMTVGDVVCIRKYRVLPPE